MLGQIEEMAPELGLLPPAPDIREILTRPVIETAYSDELNAASVVLQNHRTREASFDDILLTGDAAPETFDEIAPQLYENYYIFKAPHHGTASHWSHLFSTLLGGTRAHQQWGLRPGRAHCAGICGFSGREALHELRPVRVVPRQRLLMQPDGAVLRGAARGGADDQVPVCRGETAEAPCHIAVIGPRGRRACLCDDLPATPEVRTG